MHDMNRRDIQKKDAALYTYIGFIGIGLSFITMWVVLILETCGG